MNIIQKYIPVGTKRRSGIPIEGVKFIVAHDTGNDKSTALNNVNYFINSANDMEASAHTFIDDASIIECIPLTEKAWHVRRNITKDNEMFSGDSNSFAIGVELCYFSNDLQRSILAYNNYVWYIKELCKRYNLDPKTKIVGHFLLDPSRRTDPLNAFKHIGKSWNDFINDLSPVIPPLPPATNPVKPDFKQTIREIISKLETLL